MRRGNVQNLDFPLLLCTLAALAVGVAMVFSATNGDKEYAIRQATFGIVGLVLLFMVIQADYRFLESFTVPIYLLTLVLLGAVLVVPFMEELFWRDFCWRSIIAPNDFKLAAVGEWDWKAFLGVSLAFALVHGNWWLTSIVWAMMVGWLLVKTKSLGACIIAHGVTNLLLAAYVLRTHDWAFW